MAAEVKFSSEGCSHPAECDQVNCRLRSALEAARALPSFRERYDAMRSIIKGDLMKCPNKVRLLEESTTYRSEDEVTIRPVDNLNYINLT